MVCLVPALQAAQDRDGVLDRRLADVDLLEPALERGVLLDPLPEFVKRRGADHPELTPGEHRLEHVASIHRTLGRAGADDGVQLVDERDDLAFALLDLVQHGLQPFLELAAILCPGHHRAEVQCDKPLAAQRLGHVTGHDPLCQPFHHRGFAHAGIADQDGVVLGPAGQHLDDPADLRVPADDGIELAFPREAGQVNAVLLERLVGALGVWRGDPGMPAYLLEGCEQLVGGSACLAEHGRRLAAF